MSSTYRVVLVGGSWHGGNCTGLARGFRALGHAVELVGQEHYMPAIARSARARLLNRLLTPWFARQFNRAIVTAGERFRPDLVIVYKGVFVDPATLRSLRASGAWLANVFPDNSFRAHRYLDAAIFGCFDHIFHTKRFAIRDFEKQLAVGSISYLPHGYDPHVHRRFTDTRLFAPWACDVSFIGTWSPAKERLLGALRRSLRPGQLRIWGAQWERCTDSVLRDAIAGHGVLGDAYALAVSGSRINLGLLSERRPGASEDDPITSRTFHVPGCGGFLLHQRTPDLAERFEEGREVACFGSTDELVEKVGHYLANEDERRAIARAGYERCVAENSLVHRAQSIIERYRAAVAAVERNSPRRT